jgi:hypothetical protein
MVASKVSFPHVKEPPWKIVHNLDTSHQKMSASPITGRKGLKNITSGVAPNYRLARGTHMPWASPEQCEGIKLVPHDTKEMEVENCVVMATYLTFWRYPILWRVCVCVCVRVCVCVQKKLVLLRHNIYAILNFRQVFFHSLNISIHVIFDRMYSHSLLYETTHSNIHHTISCSLHNHLLIYVLYNIKSPGTICCTLHK